MMAEVASSQSVNCISTRILKKRGKEVAIVARVRDEVEMV